MVARYEGTDNVVGNAFGVLFLFIYITFYAGGVDACKWSYTDCHLYAHADISKLRSTSF